ncbi:hypothetical protein B0A69_00445 [Chryseobacterium shigense]|uniref:Por secretion system C-terminal sorting domain-containing protein n=1 Tax=Chryseobacterium shigense TaxID=297244 RepID=A0A1N7HZZ8_9FLAO|nr:T9SS type A sorting domain-containing protein [Chryseobacterium shigense]PQA97840.1 hypothetical protein B0A69_00445 [Chryseobacterium shigense]SIS30392.1 Por secretion system C-terminal sorting domain-containing protein [Chryseobacterium shigense]
MRKIISFLACIFFLQGFAQTVTWGRSGLLSTIDSYSQTTNKVDSNGNVYLFYAANTSGFSTKIYYIEKYTSQGYLDTGFGTNGALNINTLLGYTGPEELTIFSFELTDNDKPMLLIATENSASPKLLRLNNNGTPDQGFGTSGIKYIYTDSLRYAKHYQSELAKVNGKYFILHNYSNLQNSSKAEIGCFNESGELITGIFEQGLKQVDYGSAYNYTQLEKLVTSGNYLYAQGAGYGASVNRKINRIDISSGIQDNSYPNNPTLSLTGNNTYIFPDGKAVVGKSVFVSSSRTDLELTRYLADGNIDLSFGTNGVKKIGYPSAVLNFAKMQSLPNGDFLVGIFYVSTAGSGDRQDALMYIKKDGQLNSSFGGNITSNGVPIPGIFGIGSYGTPASYSIKPDYIVVTSSRTYMGVGLSTSKVNFNFPSLSTGEINQPYTFGFYPNPVQSTGVLTVKDKSEASFNLSDSSGKLIFTNQTFRDQTEIDFSSLTSGIYYLNVKQKNKESSRKIIKK